MKKGTVEKNKIIVFIPAYCCENQIVRVINQFDYGVQKMIDTVMVVDNMSTDRTVEVAIECGKSVLKNCNFIVWRNDDNYGLGGSHKAAFRYAVERGFDWIIVLHGDDQADIHDLIPLFGSRENLAVDCLLGARFMPGSRLIGYSFLRTFGNLVYNFLFSVVLLKIVFDLGAGLNAYRIYNYKDFYYKSFPDDLTFNYVMLIASYHRKQRLRFFPISWREEDQVSNVKLFKQAFSVLGLLLGYALRRGRFIASELRLRKFQSYTGHVYYSHESSQGEFS